MPDDGPIDAVLAPRAVGKPAYRSTRTSPQARPPATRREPPAPAPPAIQTPATLPAVTAPPTEPQPPALCARRARAVTPVPPWPSPRAAQPRHPSAKSSICRSRRIPFLHGTIRSHRCYVGGVRDKQARLAAVRSGARGVRRAGFPSSVVDTLGVHSVRVP